jgi:hypothetical protein
MRIAVLIIGLMLTVGLFIQAAVISGLSDVANDQDTGQAAAIGVLMAFLWLIACGLVMPLPRVAMVLFGISGSLFLGVLSYFGYRGKRTAKRREDERDEMMRSMLAHQANMAAAVAGSAPQVVDAQSRVVPRSPHALGQDPSSLAACPRCGAPIGSTNKFCGECGLSL